MRTRRRFALLVSILWLSAATGALLDFAFPPQLSRLTASGTEITDREGRTLALLPAAGGVWRFRADPERVSPLLRALLIAVEDRRFAWHPGVDPLALIRASAQLVRNGRVVSGGSTLAMQAARLLEPRPRALGAKLIEMARAVQLQARYGREGVLAIWLSLAPFGGNLEGVRAGALAWFGTGPEGLEPAQAALLIALPRRPEGLRPDRHESAARRVRDRVLAIGARAGLIEAEAAAAIAGGGAAAIADGASVAPISASSVPVERTALPRHAPQVAAALARTQSSVGGGVRPARIGTSLDLKLQIALERLVRPGFDALPERASLAVVVADAETREIRAIIGGDWRNTERAGALDLTSAVRSPGSALKPLLYGLAFASGIAAPEAVLADVPTRFGAYAPENFNRGFAGTVTAAEALRRSLNLPAVALLAQVGQQRFAAALRQAGAAPRLPIHEDASLALALGGAGLSLRQVTGLYAALATDGRGGSLTLARVAGQEREGDDLPELGPGRAGRSGVATEPGRLAEADRPAFLPRAAAAAVAGVLTRPFPHGGPSGIAWKTGTSWGGRDAWAFGFDARHVVGVWIGRHDGTPLPGATGLSLALPLLERVFGLLPPVPRAVAGPPLAAARTASAHATLSARGAAGAPPADTLRLLFPPPSAVLSADGPVTIRAMGGRRPLTFLVDGRPLTADSARRETGWRPPGPGFYHITVLDAGGAVARSAVRVQRE